MSGRDNARDTVPAETPASDATSASEVEREAASLRGAGAAPKSLEVSMGMGLVLVVRRMVANCCKRMRDLRVSPYPQERRARNN
jgi:hypothetical protein